MNIQLVQVVQLLVYIVIAYAAYKSKPAWLKGLFVAVILITFFVNPIRFKQEGGARLERNVNRFEVPEKVLIKEESYQDRSIRERQLLIKQSGDKQHEIHD